MNDSIDTLNQAKDAIKDVKKIALSDTDYQKQSEGLKGTLSKVGELFKQIGVSLYFSETCYSLLNLNEAFGPMAGKGEGLR